MGNPEEPQIDLVAMADIARMAQLPTATIRKWRSRGHLPEPFYQTYDVHGPKYLLWQRGDIEDWLDEWRAKSNRHGRPRDGKADDWWQT